MHHALCMARIEVLRMNSCTW